MGKPEIQITEDEPYLTPCIKIKKRLVTDLNVRGEIVQLLKEKRTSGRRHIFIPHQTCWWGGGERKNGTIPKLAKISNDNLQHGTSVNHVSDNTLVSRT